VSAIFYEHALAAILAVSVIHAMKREQSRILAVSAILAVSVAQSSSGMIDSRKSRTRKS
jgi:hypothetical protein